MSSPLLNKEKLQQATEHVLLEHIGAAAFLVAQDVVSALETAQPVPEAVSLRMFPMALRKYLPADLPADRIALVITERYHRS
jgi:hypothetical protein